MGETFHEVFTRLDEYEYDYECEYEYDPAAKHFLLCEKKATFRFAAFAPAVTMRCQNCMMAAF